MINVKGDDIKRGVLLYCPIMRATLSRIFPRPVYIPSFLLAMAVLASCATFPRSGVDRVRTIEIAVANGYRVAFVSDIHFGNNFSRERLERVVETVNALKCDCVILGGDYTRSRAEMETFAEIAAGFRSRDGTYAVLGNHDFYDDAPAFRALLRARGITVLDDSAVLLPARIAIVGIANLSDSYPDANRLLDLVPEGTFAILVSHEPDFAEETDISPYGLMLSGHTHGGQITLFGYAPILPSAYGQKYRTGTVLKDGTPVVVSNGVGYSGEVLRFRLFAPSDVIAITLRGNVPPTDSRPAR
jgi:uncharacterized protein